MKHLVQDEQLEIHHLPSFDFLSGIFRLKPGLATYFYKVNELYSLFLKFSALGLLQDVRNNFHS